MQLTVYDSLKSCEDIIRDFQQNEPINIFFTYEWMSLWKQYFAPNDREKILVFQEGGKTLGFVPLVYHHHIFLPLTVFRFFGTRKSNYIGLPARPGMEEALYNETFQYFKKHKGGVLFRIDDVSDTTPDYAILKQKAGGECFFQYSCPYSTVEDSWEKFFQKHYTKSKKRSELKAFAEKLSRIGQVEFIRVNRQEDYEKYRDLIEQTFNIHKMRFKNVINSSRYSDEGFSDFYRRVFREFANMGILDMSLICIDGIVVSFLLAFRQENTLIDYIPGFYPAFQRYSLGHVHLMELFKRLTADPQISCFDFSKGTGIYKEKWADGVTSNYSFLFAVGTNPLAKSLAFLINQTTKLKLYGRQQGWNSEIKHRLGRFKKKETVTDKIAELIPGEQLPATARTVTYSFAKLMTLPFAAQVVVLDGFYYGKKVELFEQDGHIQYIRLPDELYKLG